MLAQAQPGMFKTIEVRLLTLYPPARADLVYGALSNGGMPMGINPYGEREVRVSPEGNIELWERRPAPEPD